MDLLSLQISPKKVLGFKPTLFLVIIALSFSSFVSNSIGAQIKLAWDAVDNSAGYRLHYGTTSGRYTNNIDAGQSSTCTVPDLLSGATYYFAVTAYTLNDTQSEYSREISYTVPTDVTLTSIAIGGPSRVAENSSIQLTCTAHYSDGSSALLAGGVTWSVDTASATISSSGVLAAGDVEGGTAMNVTAVYGGQSDTHTVVVSATSPTLSSISITGPNQMDENSIAQFTCTAHYSDGTSVVPTAGVSWSENAAAATITSGGNLTAGSVTSDTLVSVTAVFNGQTDTHSVMIKKSAATLESLSISGPSRLDEQSSAQYICTALYSDSSTSTVTGSVLWRTDSEFAAIDASGQLTTRSVQGEAHVTVTAAFDGKQADLGITIYGSSNDSGSDDSGSDDSGSDDSGSDDSGSDDSGSSCALTINVTGSGTVLLDPPGGIYDCGTVVTLTAEADPAWMFDGWTGAVSDVGSITTSVIVDGSIDLSATFLEDTDMDGVPDQEEWGSASSNTEFDGNADGIADYLQAGVASLHTDDYLNYISLSAGEPARITMCKTLATDFMGDGPADHTLPLGVIAFQIEGIPPGADTTLTIHLPAGSEFDTFFKFGPTPDDPSDHWYEFMYDHVSGTGAIIEADTITLHFKDGSRGDSDLTANGVISDPGGPAILGAEPIPPGSQLSDETPSSSGATGSSGGCFIDSVLQPRG